MERDMMNDWEGWTLRGRAGRARTTIMAHRWSELRSSGFHDMNFAGEELS
jgi:hypothetical protein